MKDEEIIAYMKPKIKVKFKFYETCDHWIVIEVDGTKLLGLPQAV